MEEGVDTTDDLATVPVLDTATQEVALEDRTDPLTIRDVEKVNPLAPKDQVSSLTVKGDLMLLF